MTTSVKVTAHCPTDHQVKITRRDGDVLVGEHTIQDGESQEWHVYDGLSIQVQEEKKANEVRQQPAD